MFLPQDTYDASMRTLILTLTQSKETPFTVVSWTFKPRCLDVVVRHPHLPHLYHLYLSFTFTCL